uniref:Tripartite motif containing 35-12 n=1 Tax=Poecilia mexicana TaxID=48701 RepID=A0A3B3Y8W1_9TELE
IALLLKMLLQSEKDLTCTLCCDIFSDPVKLECSHSFCSGCLQADWAQKRTRLCPLCKEVRPGRRPSAVCTLSSSSCSVWTTRSRFVSSAETRRHTVATASDRSRKPQVMKDNMEALRKNMEDLSETVTTAEEEFRCSEDVLLLQNYKAAKGRVQQRPLLDEPQPLPGALLDEAKHLGNLSYNIWTKMKRMVSFFPVVLDPNTAEPHLSVSADLTAVTFGPRRELPGNPERFEQRHCVISHQGFSSGMHSWDVEVQTEEFWGVGVLSESVSRKGQIQAGFWGICLNNGSYAATSCTVPSTALPVTKLHRIRVQLDWEEGKVSFFDLDANNHLHTFTHNFTEKLFAYVCTKNASPLKILPPHTKLK